MHDELMSVYFNKMLRRAQLVERMEIASGAKSDNASNLITKAADILAKSPATTGERFVHPNVITLLKELDAEIKEAGLRRGYAGTPERAEMMEEEIWRSIKEGGLFLGRFLFFSAVVVAGTRTGSLLSNVGSIASILGVYEAARPGTIRELYTNFRAIMPSLPPFPEQTKKKD